MLETLLGSAGCEKVLVYLAARGEGYAREIARASGMSLYPIQRQLDRLEAGGILVSRAVGRTRVHSFNPAYPLLGELQQLLRSALALYPPFEREKLVPSAPTPTRAPGRMTQAELAAYLEERLRRG